MSEAEFQDWVDYFTAHPFDDYHRYHRPAALIATSASMGGGDVQDRLDWLAPDPTQGGEQTADDQLYAAAGIRRRKPS